MKRESGKVIKTKICLVIPTLANGGSERVMAELANFFAELEKIEIHLVLLTKAERFFSLSEKVKVHEPNFYYKKYNRIYFTIKTFSYLRSIIQRIKPTSLLSFQGNYNSFVILSTIGLKIKVFVSDRSEPGKNYGKFLNILNPIIYKLSYGIVAQTKRSRNELFRKTKHRNIKVIGNPIRFINSNNIKKENFILNVGRFIKTKQQLLLIDFFSKIDRKDWKLIFLGDGPLLEEAKHLVAKKGLLESVIFTGAQKDIDYFYSQAKIFAFTSVSEGFPNVLGEAMSAGLACISFDCNAGPSDLITDNENGFLVKENNYSDYIEKLNLLMQHEDICKKFAKNAQKRIQQNSISAIGNQYASLLLNVN